MHRVSFREQVRRSPVCGLQRLCSGSTPRPYDPPRQEFGIADVVFLLEWVQKSRGGSTKAVAPSPPELVTPTSERSFDIVIDQVELADLLPENDTRPQTGTYPVVRPVEYEVTREDKAVKPKRRKRLRKQRAMDIHVFFQRLHEGGKTQMPEDLKIKRDALRRYVHNVRRYRGQFRSFVRLKVDEMRGSTKSRRDVSTPLDENMSDIDPSYQRLVLENLHAEINDALRFSDAEILDVELRTGKIAIRTYWHCRKQIRAEYVAIIDVSAYRIDEIWTLSDYRRHCEGRSSRRRQFRHIRKQRSVIRGFRR